MNTIQIGDCDMHSPFTGETTKVNYRGRGGKNPQGEEMGIVWTGTLQMCVPMSWLKFSETQEANE